MGIIGNNKYKENERMYLAIDMTMGRDVTKTNIVSHIPDLDSLICPHIRTLYLTG